MGETTDPKDPQDHVEPQDQLLSSTFQPEQNHWHPKDHPGDQWNTNTTWTSRTRRKQRTQRTPRTTWNPRTSSCHRPSSPTRTIGTQRTILGTSGIQIQTIPVLRLTRGEEGGYHQNGHVQTSRWNETNRVRKRQTRRIPRIPSQIVQRDPNVLPRSYIRKLLVGPQ